MTALAIWVGLLLGQAGMGPTAPAPPATAVEDSAFVGASGPARFRGALEASVLSMPSGPRGGDQDLFFATLPLLSFEAGGDFGLELGALLRLRLFDNPPQQRDEDFARLLRRDDWDQLSDFGQVLRHLRVGSDEGHFKLRAGGFSSYTLGSGQLISRYSNLLNPDYHPAGAQVVAHLGPVRTEVFASDVLGGRLLAGEVSVDLGRALQGSPSQFDRYHASLEVVHDFGRAGGTAPGLTLAWLELDGRLVRERRARLSAYLGGGGRVQDDGVSMGATLGLAGEAEPEEMRLGGRLEVRKQNSGFRPGMVGHDYELARFSAVGLWQTPLAQERLPNGFSLYGEFAWAAGTEDPTALQPAAAVFTASAEHFFFGRTNLDVAFSGRALEGQGALAARFSAIGLGEATRWLFATELRYRLIPSVYLLGSGGTIFFPQPGGGLERGVFVALGAGVDFER